MYIGPEASAVLRGTKKIHMQFEASAGQADTSSTTPRQRRQATDADFNEFDDDDFDISNIALTPPSHAVTTSSRGQQNGARPNGQGRNHDDNGSGDEDVPLAATSAASRVPRGSIAVEDEGSDFEIDDRQSSDAHQRCYRELCALNERLAKKAQCSPQSLVTDELLQELSVLLPSRMSDVSGLDGAQSPAFKKYGNEFLAVCARYQSPQKTSSARVTDTAKAIGRQKSGGNTPSPFDLNRFVFQDDTSPSHRANSTTSMASSGGPRNPKQPASSSGAAAAAAAKRRTLPLKFLGDSSAINIAPMRIHPASAAPQSTTKTLGRPPKARTST